MRAAVTDGPFDADELELDVTDGVGRLDFGAVRVPMPANAQLQIDPVPGGHLRAVHVLVPQGRLSLSALAAPRSSGLWRSLSAEIAESLRREGADVRSVRGMWGREVAAGAKGALSRFIGVDGSRWMLYGVAAGPAEGADELARTLRAMIKGTVVVRGPEPYPVKTVLPLRVPAHLEAQLAVIRAADEVERVPEREAAREAGVPEEYPVPVRAAPAPQAPAPQAPAPQAPAPRREIAPARLAADDEWSVRDWAARELDEVERRLAHRDWAARELDQVELDRVARERELAGEPTRPFPDPVTAPIPQPVPQQIAQPPIAQPPVAQPPVFRAAGSRPVVEPSGTPTSEPITEPLRVIPATAAPQRAAQPPAVQQPAIGGADNADLETPRAWLAAKPDPVWPPVVTEPELSQLPAWAALAAAPQFWLDERPGRHRAAGEDPSPGLSPPGPTPT